MIRSTFAFSLSLLLLTACSSEEETAVPAADPETPPAAAAQEAPAPAADSGAVYDSASSIRALMNGMVETNARQVWHAVRYVVSEQGVEEETVPQTDEDWRRLRDAALVLIEAGNSLMLPGRAVAHPEEIAETPEFQYRPEEIAARIAADPEGWRFFLQQMQFATRETLAAIERRDVLALIERGAVINEACEGCHAEFWYR